MPSRTTPTPILLALPSKPTTVGMAEAGRKRPRGSRLPPQPWSPRGSVQSADPGGRREMSPQLLGGRTHTHGLQTWARCAGPPPSSRRPSRPLEEPVLRTARDAEPAPAPYIPARPFACRRSSSPAFCTHLLSLARSAEIAVRVAEAVTQLAHR